MAAFQESFGRIVQTVCLCAIPVLFWVCGIAWMHEHDVYLFRRFKGMFKSVRGVLAAIAIAALVVFGGSKPPTNDLQRIIGPTIQQIQEMSGQLQSLNQESEEEMDTNEVQTAVGAFEIVSVVTNAAHDFSMPADAAVCEKWMRRGAARDWAAVTNDLTWAFPFGTSVVRRITVSSAGAAILHPDFTAATNANERALRDVFDPRRDVSADASLLAPFRARLGIVPMLNWNPSESIESRFWTASTPSNTLLMTWHKVLLGRSPAKPVSFQAELKPSGDFRFAYDLTALSATDLATNVLAGAFCGGCRVTVSPPPGVVSVFDFHVEYPVDTDGDRLNDAEETLYGTDPTAEDTDGDGLSDCDEARRGTNPLDPDTDADGLSDGEEVSLGTDPLVVDTDGDGLGDGLEVEVYGSDPLVRDSDGDGIGDAAEVQSGTSPVLADTDGDGLDDDAERTAGTNPLVKDTDGDGATDGDEVAAGSDPFVTDTDGDGLLDGQELNIGSSPLLVDTDGDGFTDPEEVAMGTNPASADTDGDGIPDRDEVDWLAVRNAEWVDASGGAILMQADGQYNVYLGLVTTNLCSPVAIGGKSYDRVTVDLNGRIHLVPTNGVPALASSSGWNPDPADIAPEADDIIVAGFWDDLVLRPHLASKVRLAECPSNVCTVVQYENVGIYHSGDTNSCLTFQIVLGGDTNFPIRVSYQECATNGVVYATPTLGVVNRGRFDFRNHSRCQRLIYAYDDISGFSAPLSLGYRLGTGTDPRRADTDGDGLPDGGEFERGTSPWNPDCDGDGLLDGDEIDAGTDPLDADTDNDGMPDGWEVKYGLYPLVYDPTRHSDSDGLTNLREYQLGTDPTKSDTDGDGLTDNVEVNIGTDPAKSDTDGDGLSDYAEHHGNTSPTRADSDYDGLPDGWEKDHNLNPNSSSGINGAEGDPDGDGLSNLDEYRLGTSPRSRDTDGDGISDGDEVGYTKATAYERDWASTTNGWTVVTGIESDEYDGIGYKHWEPYGENLSIGREPLQDIVFQGNGVMFLNTDRHYEYDLIHGEPWRLSGGYVSDAALVLAPCWVSPDLSNSVSSVTVLRRTSGEESFIAIQYEGLRLLDSGANTLSVQTVLAFTNGVFRSSEFSYRDVTVENASALPAIAGVQNAVRRSREEFGIWQRVVLYDFYNVMRIAGTGTDPVKEDSDGDGLSDAQEIALGSDPTGRDSDDDGMPDGWESENGLNPLDSADASADTDGDGLSNANEYLNDCNPNSKDTDGDGVWDGDEVANGTDPANPQDGEAVPVVSLFSTLSFNIYGDWAAWEMAIEGLGPDDTRTMRLTMSGPSAAQTAIERLRKGNSYRLSMKWLNCNGHYDDNSPWYCWQAMIGGLPSVPSYENYSSTRLAGNERVIGRYWMAQNDSGLMTSHVHMNAKGGGNVAEGLESILHVYKVGMAFCSPDDAAWEELAEDRVVTDNEPLRVRVTISPRVESLDLCKAIFGETIHLATSGTCPLGIDLPIDSPYIRFMTTDTGTELRLELPHGRLRAFGLLPQEAEDGVNEIACLDMGSADPSAPSNLEDSREMLGIGHAFRGDAHSESGKSLESSPPVSIPSVSFFQSAGAEVVSASYADVNAAKRQIMNQADMFYYSGHGNLATGVLQGGFSPSAALKYWRRDLDVVVLSGCSVLNIGKYRHRSFGLGTRLRWSFRTRDAASISPGLVWGTTGAKYLLGYCWRAPTDRGGATQIAQYFASEVKAGAPYIDAWRKANDNTAGRNACAIDCSGATRIYWYWDETNGTPVWTNAVQGASSW